MLTVAKTSGTEHIPETLVIISDMEIDNPWEGLTESKEAADVAIASIKKRWADAGYRCPKLVYWNVDARNNTILDSKEGTSFVSGCSPVIFEQVMKGVTGYELMLDKLNSDRYAVIR